MLRRTVSVLPAPENEARLPPACLAELGFAEGTQAVLQASRGRLVLTEAHESHELQLEAEGLAEEVESLRVRIAQWAQRLPEVPDRSRTETCPRISRPSFDSRAECVLNDDLRTAVQRLRSAAAVTDEQLQEQWRRERATQAGTGS